jgi:hypothetical protein
MFRDLLSRVPFLRRRELTRSRRKDELKADSDARRARWNQVIAERQKPTALHKETSRETGTVTGSAPE